MEGEGTLKRLKSPRKLGRWLLLGAASALLLTGCSPQQFSVLDPAGPVASSELQLIILSGVLVLVVVAFVIVLLAFIVGRYREKPNNNAPYTPEWSESRSLEIIWWAIPIVIVVVLGIFTGIKTFSLTRPPEATSNPMIVQVQSLDWKWLFQYPGQKIATLNYLEIPTGQPVEFVLTSNAPMNSFWIPQLGGMEMTMPGMQMRLWLQADKTGVYEGRGANFTGTGFAHMTFNVKAVPMATFTQWVSQVQSSKPALTNAEYQTLVKPGLAGVKEYSSYPPNLFMKVVMKDNGGKKPMGLNGGM